MRRQGCGARDEVPWMKCEGLGCEGCGYEV